MRPDDGVNGKDACYLRVVQYLLRSRANRWPSKIQRGYGHPCRAGAPKKTADVDGPEPAMDYVPPAVWGMLNAEDACIVS